MPLVGLNFAEGNPAGVKLMLALQDLCEAHVRLPLVPGSEALAARMREALLALKA
jgi:4-hydroxy-tetrahydrodipicolinate synthase